MCHLLCCRSREVIHPLYQEWEEEEEEGAGEEGEGEEREADEDDDDPAHVCFNQQLLCSLRELMFLCRRVLFFHLHVRVGWAMKPHPLHHTHPSLHTYRTLHCCRVKSNLCTYIVYDCVLNQMSSWKGELKTQWVTLSNCITWSNFYCTQLLLTIVTLHEKLGCLQQLPVIIESLYYFWQQSNRACAYWIAQNMKWLPAIPDYNMMSL